MSIGETMKNNSAESVFDSHSEKSVDEGISIESNCDLCGQGIIGASSIIYMLRKSVRRLRGLRTGFSEPLCEDEGNLAAASDELSLEEAARRLEEDKVVKVAPRLSEQLADSEGRDDIITYIAGAKQSLTVDTSKFRYKNDRVDLTEIDTLRQLNDFFLFIENLDSKTSFYCDQARAMRENLTFIGKKELEEAAAAIAASWKARLKADKKLCICAITGEVTKMKDEKGKKPYDHQIKSDEYLLNIVLSQFSEMDWMRYGKRIIVDRDDIKYTNKDHVAIVLLDDWTISGGQLAGVYNLIAKQYPDREESIEVQLIAAGKERIERGLVIDEAASGGKYIPVRSYFLAHDSKDAIRGVHVTGSHSSADFGFEDVIVYMVDMVRSKGYKDFSMPPGTNIVRPYRQYGMTRDRLVHIRRARGYRRFAMTSGWLNSLRRF